jgi:hypothetical protein
VRPHDTANLAAIVVEHREIIVLAEPGWLQRQHGTSMAANARVGRLDHSWMALGRTVEGTFVVLHRIHQCIDIGFQQIAFSSKKVLDAILS